MSFFSKLFGDPHASYVKKLRPLVDTINALEPEFLKLSEEQLHEKTAEFRKRLEGKEDLEDILPEAFAAVREAARRVLGQRHYDVQLLGGMVLHRGAIAEMRTGEGKTIMATLPSYLNALPAKGVHVVTVNDYLARRDAAWMGRVHHALGLTVACITHESAYVYDPGHKSEISSSAAVFKVEHEFLRPVTRREAYAADITYGTNNEFGFDYLRDNMVTDLQAMAQRGHFFAVVDEVDSILVDEARTPLIISAPAEESEELYYKFADLIVKLKENDDYNVDEKMKAATLTEGGISKLEKWLNISNLYEGGISLVHHAEQALRAHALYRRDKEYVVKDGQVIIVDEFTGRLMPGRRWSEGLHQAVEAKERVKIERESQTLATITFQNYFRMYKKLSGMTGTAATESEEFHKIYNLEVVVVPTNRAMVRKDFPDRVYRSEKGKYDAVVEEVKARHLKGQPVLVGTISIEKNEILSQLLERSGVPHNLLNAKNHEREGEIIAQAGRKGAVTIATNMAGRGVDILLGGNPPTREEADEVRALGGLLVLGTERHESRRIDNQLRGRSGRQGDPGASQFYVSLEDDLMRIFAGDRVKALMTRFNIPENMPIESKIVSKSIESAQGKVEQHNFDIRKHLLEYDDVLNKHRDVIYRKRKEILALDHNPPQPSLTLREGGDRSVPPLRVRGGQEGLREQTLSAIEHEIEQVVLFHTPTNGSRDDWNIKEILETARTLFPLPPQLEGEIERSNGGNGSKLEDTEARTKIVETLFVAASAQYEAMEKQFTAQTNDQEIMRKIEKSLWLRAIDTLWVEHLDAIEHLRKGIGLRAYGQREPLVEYKKEAYRLFQELQHLIEKQVVYGIFKIGITTQATPSLLQRRGMQLSAPAKTMEKNVGSGLAPDRGGAPDAPEQSSVRGRQGPTLQGTTMVKEEPKVGRNDPCYCGSGKKYKKCHGV